MVQGLSAVEEDIFFSRHKPRYIRVKQKPDEWQKVGKYSRVICDLTVTCSLRAPWLPDMLKEAMFSVCRVASFLPRRVKLEYVKSLDMDLLSDLFADMLGKYVAVVLFFSDDAVLAVRTSDGRILYFNLDISSCDSHNGSHVASALSRSVPYHTSAHMKALTDQWLMPVVVGYGKDRLRFVPREHQQPSGSVLTTVANNEAICSVLTTLLTKVCHPRPADETKDIIRSTFEASGWSIVAEQVSFEGLQFLKCSPARLEDGTVRAYLNHGVILRAMGQKIRDLPGSGPLLDRARLFNSALVSGFQHGGNTTLYRILKDKWGLGDASLLEPHWVRDTMTSTRSPPIPDSAVCARYGLDQPLLDELHYLYSIADVGDLVSCEAIQRMIYVDYGFPPVVPFS